MYRWLEHTSEVELSIEAESAGAVFEEATRAFGELLAEAPPGESVERHVNAQASDLPALLVEWLSELAYLAETDAFIPERALRVDLADTSLEALVAGRRAEPQSLVKGVTYHRLEMKRADGSWRARVVLDV